MIFASPFFMRHARLVAFFRTMPVWSAERCRKANHGVHPPAAGRLVRPVSYPRHRHAMAIGKVSERDAVRWRLHTEDILRDLERVGSRCLDNSPFGNAPNTNIPDSVFITLESPGSISSSGLYSGPAAGGSSPPNTASGSNLRRSHFGEPQLQRLDPSRDLTDTTSLACFSIPRPYSTDIPSILSWSDDVYIRLCCDHGSDLQRTNFLQPHLYRSYARTCLLDSGRA